MSYVDAWFDRERDRIHVVERVNGEREYREYPANYVFYYDDPKGKHRSIYDTPVSRVSTKLNKDFQKELVSKQKELSELLKIKTEMSKINNQLTNDLEKANKKIKEFERSQFREENNRAQSQNDGEVIVTLGERLVLIAVNDVVHRGSDCTELVFSNGEKQWMKKRTFDKFGLVTHKAISLINESVITSSWNPKSNPTLWKKQGYFRNIYKAN